MPLTSDNTRVHTVTIANGGTLSDAVDLEGWSLVGIRFPAAMSSATITFTAAEDDTATYVAVVNEAGTTPTISATAAKYVAIAPSSIYANMVGKIKVVAVGAEGAERLIKLVTRSVPN